MVIYKILDRIKESGCIIRDLCHVYCPGCGGTRALEALLRFQILESLYYNPVVILLVIFAAVMIILYGVERFDPRHRKHYKIRLAASTTVLVVWLVFWLARNYFWVFHGIDMLGDFS